MHLQLEIGRGSREERARGAVRGDAGGSWRSLARIARCVLFVAAMSATVVADDCPQPLESMPAVVDDTPSGLVRRRPLAITESRIVHADYLRSRAWDESIVDVGTGWMENRSNTRRRIRYHHEFPLQRRPMLVMGAIASGATRPATFDFRIGCDRLDTTTTYHVVEGEADRFAMRVEAVLEPGERVVLCWNVALDIVVAGRLPNDRDGDGDVDVDDLAAALASIGGQDPEREVEALRSLIAALGDGIGRTP